MKMIKRYKPIPANSLFALVTIILKWKKRKTQELSVLIGKLLLPENVPSFSLFCSTAAPPRSTGPSPVEQQSEAAYAA
jgi:hypothetical protein